MHRAVARTRLSAHAESVSSKREGSSHALACVTRSLACERVNQFHECFSLAHIGLLAGFEPRSEREVINVPVNPRLEALRGLHHV